MMKIDNEFKLPDTGQTHCYDQDGKEITPLPGEELYGQNGCFVINPVSYTKLNKKGEKLPDSALWQQGLRMILDNNTGLIWEVKSPQPEDVNYFDEKYSWHGAQAVYIKKLNEQGYGGFCDWRVPNKDELRSIIDYSLSNPALDPWYFPHCRISFYWCSATYEMQPYFAWVISFGLGSATANSKTNLCHVRAVRAGYNSLFGQPDVSRFIDNADGTITDQVTGLMWQRGENERMSWYEALKFCQRMRLAGHDDWRMPNIKELNTILNLTYKDGWWYFKEFFPAEGLQPPLLHYFSSSVFQRTYAWVTNFNFGYDGYYANKNSELLFRAVRNVSPPRKEKKSFQFPDTGQILFYDDEGNQIDEPDKGQDFYGLDGVFKIHPMSFTRLRENGKSIDQNIGWEQGWRMVMDNNTGLIWEVKSSFPEDINYRGNKYKWREANLYIETLNKENYGGFSDWRLPNREEIRTIVDYNNDILAVNPDYFSYILPDFYWSKDPYVSDPKLIWGTYFPYGCSICYVKDSLFYVLAVRGGYNPSFGDMSSYNYQDNGDGTITDRNIGLMWKKDESPLMGLVEALRYCQDLRLAGHEDWRLPNIKELASLVDLSYKDTTWYHKKFFPEVITKPQGFYLASSTFSATFGWGVNFQFGYDGYYADKKNGKYPFRPVRNIRKDE